MNYRSLIMATARTSALYLSGFFIPLLGQLLALFTPVPLTLAYVRDGRLTGAAALLAVVAISTLIGGWQIAMAFILGFGVMAIGISEGMLRRMKPENIALLGGLLPSLATLALLLAYFALVGKDPVVLAEHYLRNGLAEAAKAYAAAGLTEVAEAAASLPNAFIYYLVRLFPGIFVATMVGQAACCFCLVRAFLMRKQPVDAEQPSLALWHAPDTWVWGLVAALVLLAVPHEPTRLTGWNALIVFGTLYFTQGIALTDFYLRKLQLHSMARMACIAIIMLLPPFMAGIIALGVVDVWADFRKVRAAAKTP